MARGVEGRKARSQHHGADVDDFFLGHLVVVDGVGQAGVHAAVALRADPALEAALGLAAGACAARAGAQLADRHGTLCVVAQEELGAKSCEREDNNALAGGARRRRLAERLPGHRSHERAVRVLGEHNLWNPAEEADAGVMDAWHVAREACAFYAKADISSRA